MSDMEFIAAKQFLKQSKEIQDVFIKWWKPSFGDVFATKKVYDEIDVIIDVFADKIWGMNQTFKGNIYDFVDSELEPIPLFTEGQLRQFIEDMTKTKVQLYYNGDEGYSIEVGYKDSLKEEIYDYYDNLGHNALQAYWRVAIQICKDEIERNKIIK